MFLDVPFPSLTAQGAIGGPEWLTQVVTTGGGDDFTNQYWANPKRRYNVASGIKTDAQLSALLNFVTAVAQGRANSFPFADPKDKTAVGQQFGVGNGATSAFQLVKLYTIGGVTYTRKIKLPIASTLVVYDNGTPTVAFTLSARGSAGGLVTFASAPAAAHVLTADFTFDTPARFEADYTAFLWNAVTGNLETIGLIEDRLR